MWYFLTESGVVPFNKQFKKGIKMNYDLETLLKAPFQTDSLSWRIGNKSNWDRANNKPKDPKKPVKAQMLVYIDSRDVQDRLDEVCKLCGCRWENDFKEVNGRLVCNLTITDESGIKTIRSDGAGDTDFEAEKGGLSDALKRAAVLFGVGRYLYNAKNFNTWLTYEENDNDYTMPSKAKEQLADVARLLGESVKTYHYWLGLIDSVETKEDFEEVKNLAGIYYKREQWSAGNLETFRKHVKDKKKELEEKEDGAEK